MNKNIIIVISVVILGIIIGVGIVYSLPKQMSNYEKILEAANRDYEINITYSYMEEDILNFDGTYSSSQDKMDLNDDEQIYAVSGNLYSYFTKYLINQNYEDSDYFYVVSFAELLSDPFYTFLKENSLSYICTYNFFDDKILGVDCLNDNSNFTVDFYFDS